MEVIKRYLNKTKEAFSLQFSICSNLSSSRVKRYDSRRLVLAVSLQETSIDDNLLLEYLSLNESGFPDTTWWAIRIIVATIFTGSTAAAGCGLRRVRNEWALCMRIARGAFWALIGSTVIRVLGDFLALLIWNPFCRCSLLRKATRWGVMAQ